MRPTRMAVALAAVASLVLGASATPAHAATAGPTSAAALSTVQAGADTAAAGSAAAGSVTPNVTFNPSCSGNTTWVVILEYKLPNRGLYHWCFGYTGTWVFPSHAPYDYASSFCAGNNRGTIKVVWQGVTRTYSFGPGTRIAWPTTTDFARLVSLTITGWSGTNKCPT